MDFEWYDVLMWVHCNKGATLVWGVDSGEAVWAGREAYGTVLSTQICYKPKTAWKNTASVFWWFFLTTACSLQDLSSPTRDWTRVLCNGSMDCQEIPYNVWGFFVFWGALGLSGGMWTLNSSLWDLGPCPGIKSGPPALGAYSLNQWTTRDPPYSLFLSYLIQHQL